MQARQFAIAALAPFLFAGIAQAGCELDIDQLDDLVGYQIDGIKTVAGWVDEDDGKVGNQDDWEGCRYNRKIIFDDGSSVICKSYRHASAWGKQKAVIFSRYSNQKICIDDELMDVRGG